MQRHQAVLALRGDLRGHLVGQLSGGSPLLGREGEDSDVVKALLGDEIQEVLELLLGFAGIAHDEGGAEHGLGELLANARQNPVGDIGLPGAIHRP